MTQNKHKATHDQLIETKQPLWEAWHSLLQWFSWVRHGSASHFSLLFWHTRILIHMLTSRHFRPTEVRSVIQLHLWPLFVFQLQCFTVGQCVHFNNTVKSTSSAVLCYLECSFLGVPCFLVCHRWLAMVMASTLADMVLAGIWLNCFLSELYLYRPSIILAVMLLGPMPASLTIASVSGQ